MPKDWQKDDTSILVKIRKADRHTDKHFGTNVLDFLGVETQNQMIGLIGRISKSYMSKDHNEALIFGRTDRHRIFIIFSYY